jgi:hypothetical protein
VPSRPVAVDDGQDRVSWLTSSDRVGATHLGHEVHHPKSMHSIRAITWPSARRLSRRRRHAPWLGQAGRAAPRAGDVTGVQHRDVHSAPPMPTRRSVSLPQRLRQGDRRSRPTTSRPGPCRCRDPRDRCRRSAASGPRLRPSAGRGKRRFGVDDYGRKAFRDLLCKGAGRGSRTMQAEPRADTANPIWSPPLQTLGSTLLATLTDACFLQYEELPFKSSKISQRPGLIYEDTNSLRRV